MKERKEGREEEILAGRKEGKKEEGRVLQLQERGRMPARGGRN